MKYLKNIGQTANFFCNFLRLIDVNEWINITNAPEIAVKSLV